MADIDDGTPGEHVIIETIDLTPTWEGLTPALLAVITGSETVEGYKAAEAELLRMARLADRYVELVTPGICSESPSGEHEVEHGQYKPERCVYCQRQVRAESRWADIE